MSEYAVLGRFPRALVALVALVALLAAGACGPRPVPPAVVPATATVPAATPTLPDDAPPAPAAASAAAATCRIIDNEVEWVEELEVTPEGLEPFRVDAKGVRLEASFNDAPPAQVLVRGRFEFTAAAPKLPLRHWGPPLPAGGVTLSGNSRIERATGDGAGLLADVVLGVGVTVRGVRLPCDELSVDEPHRLPTNLPASPPNEPALFPAALPLQLADGPAVESSLTVEADDPAWLPFLERDRQGDFVLVSLEWHDGASLSGWAPRAVLTPGTASGFGGGPNGGEPSCGRPGTCGGSTLYCGPADVATGATVFAEPGVGPWATVLDGNDLEVVAVDGEEWIKVRRVPGLTENGPCDDLQHAWVAREQVRRPGEERQPRAGACEDGTTGLLVEPQTVVIECADGRLRCDVELPLVVRNCSGEPVELVEILGVGADDSVRVVITPAPEFARLAPGDRFERMTPWYEGPPIELRARARTADGFPVDATPGTAEFHNPAREAAQAACQACDGTWGGWGIMQSEGCDCRTRDAGRECTAGNQCEGRCMFENWAPLADDDPLAAGAPVCGDGERRYVARGACSERTQIFGCVSVIGEPKFDCRRPGMLSRVPTICLD